MDIRPKIKFGVAAVFAILILPFLQAPAAKLAEAIGFDKALSDRWGPVVNSASGWLTTIAQNPWYIFFSGLLCGVVVALWVDVRWKSKTGGATADNSSVTGFSSWPTSYAPISVIGRTFRSERVLLDGHSYLRCIFENVTFVYNGTTPIQMTLNTISGKTMFASDSPSISMAWMFLETFKQVPSMGVLDVPQGAIVEPMRILSRPTPKEPESPR
jgi:hypothetical protein